MLCYPADARVNFNGYSLTADIIPGLRSFTIIQADDGNSGSHAVLT